MNSMDDFTFDAIVIGSGFGGTMAARQLIGAGMKVLMIERGGWVARGPENWSALGSASLTPHNDMTSPLYVPEGGYKKRMGLYACVGGPSVFYGGVSFRFREKDFETNPEIAGDSGASWPIRYRDLEPYYSKAEQILNVSGEAGIDPTEPPRSASFPQCSAPLAAISEKVKMAMEAMLLHPFQLPLAINYEDTNRNGCAQCTTCDTYACAVEAKNDLATMVLPGLLKQGMLLKTNTVATFLKTKNSRISAVECVDRSTGERRSFRGQYVVLAAGALASPHLLLASDLQDMNPGGRVVGRYLMRHVNAIIYGIFPGRADRENRFHKQLAIMDYYFGHPNLKTPMGKLGSLQQMPTPPMVLVQHAVPGWFGKLMSHGVKLLTGMLAIAEDQPQFSNCVTINPAVRDVYGLPQLTVRHRYSERDLAAVGILKKEAKKILCGAGAWSFYVHTIRSFSHAVGTVRMGNDPDTSALDENCRFRGLENLFVTDGSCLPSSAAVNPSLTIAANALRVGDVISKL